MYSSWSNIRVANDLLARSSNFFISSPRILATDASIMIRHLVQGRQRTVRVFPWPVQQPSEHHPLRIFPQPGVCSPLLRDVVQARPGCLRPTRVIVSPCTRYKDDTHIFYVNDHLSNGECHFNWVDIDTLWHPLEERLCEPRGNSKALFCSRLPIRDRHLRVRRGWL